MRPKGLVGGSTRLLGVSGPLLHLMSLLAAKRGAGNTLVCVGSLLDNHLLVGALSAAAAGADEPEEA